MKIVHSYVVRNDIKAITIEESKDKLVITQKNPHQNEEMPFEQNEPFDVDVEIKKEPDDESEDTAMIKHELEMNIDDSYEAPERTNAFDEDQQPAVPDLHDIPAVPQDLTRLDLLLKINQEILRKVNGLDTKLNAQMNLLNFNLPN